jgi:hypothetical protein
VQLNFNEHDYYAATAATSRVSRDISSKNAFVREKWSFVSAGLRDCCEQKEKLIKRKRLKGLGMDEKTRGHKYKDRAKAR